MAAPTAAPTATDCSNPGTCFNRLRDQIYAVSARCGTEAATLQDPNSPQARAANWILEECDAAAPIDPCTQSQLILNEQRYAAGLEVMPPSTFALPFLTYLFPFAGTRWR